MNAYGIDIIGSIISGIYAMMIFILVVKFVPVKQRLEFFGIFNKWVVLVGLLYIFGSLKHGIGYYLSIESNYCKETGVCEKIAKQKHSTLIEQIESSLGLLQSVWVENIGEGILFVIIGLPLFTLIKNHLLAAFMTGVLAHNMAEYIGIHNYFCKTSCNVTPLFFLNNE